MGRGNPDFFGQSVSQPPGSIVRIDGSISLVHEDDSSELFNINGKISVLCFTLKLGELDVGATPGINMYLDNQEILSSLLLSTNLSKRNLSFNRFFTEERYSPINKTMTCYLNKQLDSNYSFSCTAVALAEALHTFTWELYYKIRELI